MSVPKFTFALKTIEPVIDSTEVGNDEPYLLVVGVDFSNVHALDIGTTRYGPFSLGESETATTTPMPFGTPTAVYNIMDTLPGVVRRPFWGVNSHMPRPIDAINKMAFVMIMMENDDGDPEEIRKLVHGAALNALAKLTNNPAVPPNSLKQNDFSNAIMNAVNKLRSSGALDGGLNNDDFVDMQPFNFHERDFEPPLVGRREIFPRSFFEPSNTQGLFNIVVELAFS